MKAVGTVLAIGAAATLLAGCGSGAKGTTHHAEAPATTIAGVGLMMSDPPPTPSTPLACVRRWNAAGNAGGRAAAKRREPKADRALVRAAGSSGYFGDYSGRCLIYLVARQRAAVFVETAVGKYQFTAGASGRFSSNADLARGTRLRLR
jgi:hypothetical protein